MKEEKLYAACRDEVRAVWRQTMWIVDVDRKWGEEEVVEGQMCDFVYASQTNFVIDSCLFVTKVG